MATSTDPGFAVLTRLRHRLEADDESLFLLDELEQAYLDKGLRVVFLEAQAQILGFAPEPERPALQVVS